MLLREIAPAQAIEKAQNELKVLLKQATAAHQGISPTFKARVEKARAAVAAAKQAATAVPSDKHEVDRREFWNSVAKKKDSESSTAKQQRYGENIKKGQEETKALNNSSKITDSLDELAEKVYAYVKQATNDGSVKITGADIAHHFNKPVTSVNRWLTKPAFIKAARLMGRR